MNSIGMRFNGEQECNYNLMFSSHAFDRCVRNRIATPHRWNDDNEVWKKAFYALACSIPDVMVARFYTHQLTFVHQYLPTFIDRIQLCVFPIEPHTVSGATFMMW